MPAVDPLEADRVNGADEVGFTGTEQRQIYCVIQSVICNYTVRSYQQYFPVVLFIMLYEVVLTFEFVDEILKCDHSNESY